MEKKLKYYHQKDFKVIIYQLKRIVSRKVGCNFLKPRKDGNGAAGHIEGGRATI